MGKSKSLAEKNKDLNPKIEKDDKIIKKSKEAQKKQKVSKVKKAVKEGVVKVPKAEKSPVEKNIKKNEISPAKLAKLEEKKLKKQLKKAAKSEADEKVVKKQAEDAVKDVEKKQNNGSMKSKKPLKKSKKETEPKKIIPGGPDETVFVGNLPTNTKRVQVSKLFAPYGKVLSVRFRTASGKVLFKHKMRKETGALNAYVVLDSAEAAAKALELNGFEFKKQHLRVQKTESKEEKYDPKVTVFVGNLKFSATDEKLHQIFSNCGDIDYVRTIQSPDNKGCKGVAYVCFKNADSVGLALELKGTMLDDRPIHVERYSTNKLGAKDKREAEIKSLQTKKGKAKKDNFKAKMQNVGKKYISNKAGDKKNTQGKDKKESDAIKKTGEAKKNLDKSLKKDFAGGDKKKKSEFRGVKSEVIKKKKPKKKVQSQLKRLANKIAPKE